MLCYLCTFINKKKNNMKRGRSRERGARERERRRDRERSRERDSSTRRTSRSSRHGSRDASRRQGSKRSRRSPGESARRTSLERSRSTTTNSDFAKLTDVLASIVKINSKRSSNNFINEKILPEFDPSVKTQSAADWIDKVNSCAILYDWDDKTKLYLAVCRLRGNAKVWYEELHETQLSWLVFSHSLKKQFPGELSFGILFREAAVYESTPGQDLQTYCFKKVGKLNKLKLDLAEDKIVDFVTRGLHDEKIRTTVLSTRCKTINELNNCLAIFRETGEKFKEINKRLVNTRDMTIGKSKVGDEKKNACFHCGKVGHRKYECPDIKEASGSGSTEIKKSSKSEKPTCGHCHKVGHKEENCWSKK